MSKKKKKFREYLNEEEATRLAMLNNLEGLPPIIADYARGELLAIRDILNTLEKRSKVFRSYMIDTLATLPGTLNNPETGEMVRGYSLFFVNSMSQYDRTDYESTFRRYYFQ